jgi:hypothetical protein
VVGMSVWQRLLGIGMLALLTACGSVGVEGGAGETSATSSSTPKATADATTGAASEATNSEESTPEATTDATNSEESTPEATTEATNSEESTPEATTEATNSEESTTEPPIEPTEPESTQPVEEQTSIEIANAPIGGNSGEGPHACADVNWLGTKPIPKGVTIKLGSIHLDPDGIFELDQGSCSGDDHGPSCAGRRWKGSDPTPCSIGAKQVAFGGDRKDVRLILAVTVACRRQADCDSLAADPENRGGSQIVFRSGSPPEEQSEEQSGGQSEKKTEEESEEQSGGQSEKKTEEESEEQSGGQSEKKTEEESEEQSGGQPEEPAEPPAESPADG